ncbi:M48 family metallopeptidase [Marinitoga arctica]
MNILKTEYMEINYSIIKSKRKSISIIIENTGDVVVRAPKFLSDYEIKKFVFDKRHWIISKLLNIKPIKEKSYIDGERFLFLGKYYKLITIEGNYKVGIQDNYIYILLKREFFENVDLKKDMILKWYKSRAKEIITQRVDYYSNLMNLKYNKIYIRDQKTRWGSCSGKNNLSFNFRIIMAPMRKIDYIIIHELAHIKHKHHRKEFWDYVKHYCDDYLESRKWFKENGNLLIL